MSKQPALNMTHGNPLPLLVKFAVPLMLGSLFQQLYSFVDTAIIGQCIGTQAMTAVGITSSLNYLVMGIVMGSAIGFCIPISQSVGAGEWDEFSRNFWNGFYLCLGISLVVCLGVTPFVKSLLTQMNTPSELLCMADQYLTVVFAGQITTTMYNYFSGVLRALGDSQRPFWFLVISSCVNIVLDLVLILVIPMGVTGAALGTVISQGISVALCIWWLMKKTDVIRTANAQGESLMRLSGRHIRRLCRMGLPMGLEYSIGSIGGIVLQSSINTLGAVAAAAQVCGEKIRSIATIPLERVGTAMATYVGQNYGAKRMDRIGRGIRCGLLIQTIYAAAAWFVLLLLKKPLVFLLLGETTSPEALASQKYLSVISSFFLFHGFLMIFRNTVQGMGYGSSTLVSSAMEIIGRSLAGLLAVYFNNFTMACISAPLAWMLAMIYCGILCIHFLRKGCQSNGEKTSCCPQQRQ